MPALSVHYVTQAGPPSDFPPPKFSQKAVVFGVGFALLLPVFFGLDGVLYSMPVSDVLTFVAAAFIIVKTYRELNAEGAHVL